MPHLARREWVPAHCEDYIQTIAEEAAGSGSDEIERRILALADENRAIHEDDCVNLNPATNTMNPKAEALLAAGLGSRPSLGYPGDKYEMGLEAIEKIEVLAAELAAEIFQAGYAEIRVGSGALANLYAFMATAKPGDAIVVPSADVGGHVTHHKAGAAGLYGLDMDVEVIEPGRARPVVGDVSAHGSRRHDDRIAGRGRRHEGVEVGERAGGDADLCEFRLKNLGGELGRHHLDLFDRLQPHLVLVAGPAERRPAAEAAGQRRLGLFPVTHRLVANATSRGQRAMLAPALCSPAADPRTG